MTVTYQDLIRRLALAYDGGEPIFATEMPDGTVLDGAEMQELYREVMGEPKRPTPDSTWYQCPHCSMWQIHSGPLPETS